MYVQGNVKCFGQLNEHLENLTLNCFTRIMLHSPIIEANLANGRQPGVMLPDKVRHVLGRIQIEMCRIQSGGRP